LPATEENYTTILEDVQKSCPITTDYLRSGNLSFELVDCGQKRAQLWDMEQYLGGNQKEDKRKQDKSNPGFNAIGKSNISQLIHGFNRIIFAHAGQLLYA
jgi:hypothetical protein